MGVVKFYAGPVYKFARGIYDGNEMHIDMVNLRASYQTACTVGELLPLRVGFVAPSAVTLLLVIRRNAQLFLKSPTTHYVRSESAN